MKIIFNDIQYNVFLTYLKKFLLRKTMNYDNKIINKRSVLMEYLQHG